jgi:carboxyl-terminal processing protease
LKALKLEGNAKRRQGMSSKWQKFGLVSLGAVIGVLLSLNFSAIADKQAPAPLPVEELRTFSEIFGRIKSDYVEPVEDKKLIKEAITGMVSGLDPHSAYLDQDAFKELQVGTQGEFGGLGIEVGMEDGFVKVISPIDDSPAAKAGLKTGDLIIKLDESAVKGMALNDAVKRMRGKPGSDIKLTVLRKGESKPLVFTLTRAVIKVKSVKVKELEPGYASLRVTQFQEHTGENLAQAIQDLYKKNNGTMKGLVLDLRNDPGGLLNSAVAVSAAFLPQDVLVVYTDGRTDDSKMRLNASKENYLRGSFKDDFITKLPGGVKSVPMVVLVNGGSASASEIVAGALQDHKRATIIGTQTFGKGSVQTIVPLANNTAVKLTTARYYTPSGRSIQAKGIEPDVKVEDPNNPSTDVGIREADLERHLGNPTEKEKEEAKAKESKAESKTESKSADSKSTQAKAEGKEKDKDKDKDKLAEGEEKPDFQLTQALNHLKGLPVLSKQVN